MVVINFPGFGWRNIPVTSFEHRVPPWCGWVLTTDPCSAASNEEVGQVPLPINFLVQFRHLGKYLKKVFILWANNKCHTVVCQVLASGVTFAQKVYKEWSPWRLIRSAEQLCLLNFGKIYTANYSEIFTSHFYLPNIPSPQFLFLVVPQFGAVLYVPQPTWLHGSPHSVAMQVWEGSLMGRLSVHHVTFNWL